MAKSPKGTASNKVFGGTALEAGTYIISKAVVSEDTANIGGTDMTYDALHIEVKTETGVEVEATLSLNGCWRPRRGEDGKKYQASGSFYDQVLGACRGKSFDATRDWINANLVGKKIAVAYTDYPSQSGGWSRVPVVNVLP